MGRPSQAPSADKTAEELLLEAVRAPNPEKRLASARAGLRCFPLADDIHVLLERQLYTGRMEQHRFRQALEHARNMIAVGVLRDVGYHDAARAHAALGELDRAIAMQRLAARASHPQRRSFHRWNLATLQHFAGRPEAALDTLARAMRCSTRDRALLSAHILYVRLDAGLQTRNADAIVQRLASSPSREGYGRFLLGMIAYHRGDTTTARAELRAFLARHARAEPVRAITLREELRRARLALGELDAN